MKTTKQATQISRIGVVFVFTALLFGCKHPVTIFSIEGEFVVTSTSIFLTAAEDEKEDLFKTCVSKKFMIRANKLYVDTTCLFDGVKDITIVDSFQTTVDSFKVMNPEKFSYFIDDSIGSHRRIGVYKARQVFSNRTNDSLFIVKKTMDTIILDLDPYFLKLVRVKH